MPLANGVVERLVEDAVSGGSLLTAGFLSIAVIESVLPWRPSTRLTAQGWFGNSVYWLLILTLRFLWAALGRRVAAQFAVPTLFRFRKQKYSSHRERMSMSSSGEWG